MRSVVRLAAVFILSATPVYGQSVSEPLPPTSVPNPPPDSTAAQFAPEQDDLADDLKVAKPAVTTTESLATWVVAQRALASERLSQAGADPWLASTSASLFARPSLWEGFKFSNDTTTEKKSTYSVSIGYSALTRSPSGASSPILDGMQLSGAYNVTDKIASGGLKWNLDTRDVRLLSDEKIQTISRKVAAASAECTAENLLECAKKKREARIEALKHDGRWKPAFALAIGGAYNVEAARRDKSDVLLSVDLTSNVGPTTFALTFNAEARNAPVDEMAATTPFGWQAGGGAQLSDAFELGVPLTLSAGGKVFACLSTQCPDKSTIELVAGIGVHIQKTTQVGFTVQWAGDGDGLSDAIGAIALSHSWTPPAE